MLHYMWFILSYTVCIHEKVRVAFTLTLYLPCTVCKWALTLIIQDEQDTRRCAHGRLSVLSQSPVSAEISNQVCACTGSHRWEKKHQNFHRVQPSASNNCIILRWPGFAREWQLYEQQHFVYLPVCISSGWAASLQYITAHCSNW